MSPEGCRLPRVGQSRSPSPFGRTDLIESARAQLGAGHSVLVYGPAGIGKSTVLDAVSAGYAAANAKRTQVLRAAAAEVESGLPYLTLVDLFGAALAEHGSLLPGHLRAALDAALLRTAPPASAQDELAVRLAVLELVRVLAGHAPVLLVLDDAQWIDEPSAGVLRFVARRVHELNVRVLAAERGASPTRSELLPPPGAELPVAPLTGEELDALLRERFASRLSRATLGRIADACDGNPLFAVELGRAAVEHGEPAAAVAPLPVPDRLRRLLSARLAALPAEAGPALLLVAAAARPTRALVERAGVALEVGLSAPVEAGVLAIGPEAIGFTHPLLREMVYADAPAAARLTAHATLATVVDDPVERARHLALARPHPDEGLADTLADAAAVARRRGAPHIAADLAHQAADRTPDPHRAAVRRLDAARHAYAAGQIPSAQALAAAALRGADGSDEGSLRTRVGARLLLVDMEGQDWSRVSPLLEAAFCDAEEVPDLAARVRLFRAWKAQYDGDIEEALTELKLAEPVAEQAGATETLVEVLALRGIIEAPLNMQGSEEVLERAATLSRGLPLSSGVVTARQLATGARLRRGDVPEAVRRVEALRVAVERAGTMGDLAGVLHTVASVYSRAGRAADALAAGRYCLRLFNDLTVASSGPGLLVGALVELGGGTLDAAEEYARAAIRASTEDGDGDWLKGGYATLGQVLLLRGDPVAAAEQMRQGWQWEQRRGPVDPAMMIWHADFVEALVGAGAREEAQAVLTDVRAQAHRLGRDVVQLGLDRAQALLTAAEGDPRGAAEQLEVSLRRWATHPYPFEVARAWHVLGAVERRAHRRAAAREAFSEAHGRYTAIGAHPWREAVAGDLARLDGGRSGALSPTEQRIVELVRSGATNRDIARTTFLSIKAVEANLTRLYRRYGVRNRDQLARTVGNGG
jgi:DNA-binding CsgD family transcriptional regulator